MRPPLRGEVGGAPGHGVARRTWACGRGRADAQSYVLDGDRLTLGDDDAADGGRVAEATITPIGQVPLPYAVSVVRSAFEPDHQYVLTVRIAVGDDVLFVSGADVPVTVDPADQHLDLVLVRAGA